MEINIESFKITKTQHLVVHGECIMNNVDIIFSYIPKNDKFTFIGYGDYQSHKLPQHHNQIYAVGREIAKFYKNQFIKNTF